MADSQQYPQQPQYPQQAYYGAPSPGGDGKGPQMYQTGGAPSPMAQQGYYAPPQGMYGGQQVRRKALFWWRLSLHGRNRTNTDAGHAAHLQPMYYGQPGMQQHPPNVIVQQQPRGDSGPGCCACLLGCCAALLWYVRSRRPVREVR